MVVKLNVMFMTLLWAGFLPFISSHWRTSWTKAPVCEAYNLPEQTTWIARTSCDEHKKFRCDVHQGAKVETVCKNGEWIEELACPKVQCPAGKRFNNTNEESPPGILDQTYKLKCSIGATGNGSFLIVQCSADGNKGRWTVINNCELVLCPSTEGIINFRTPVEAGLPFERFESSTCARGYTRNGDKGSVKCTADGRNPYGNWTIITDCELVQCPAGRAESTSVHDTLLPDGVYDDVYYRVCSIDQYIRYGYSRAFCWADGSWFEEPCRDCFFKLTFKLNYHIQDIPADDPLESCDQSCQDDGNCTNNAVITSPEGGQSCYLVFESKVIYFGQDNQRQCIERCNTTSDCVALNHWKFEGVCVLVNDFTIPDKFSHYDKTLAKGYCPFLL